MRQLTFPGFLRRYVQELSIEQCASLHRLAEEAEQTNARLREPLLLYAIFSGSKVKYDAARYPRLAAMQKELLSRYTAETLFSALQENDLQLDSNYRKVWNSYLFFRDQKENDNATKEKMRQKILQMQKTVGVTNYRLYRDLHLNPGNANSWLKNGDPAKVSLTVARSIYHHLKKMQFESPH